MRASIGPLRLEPTTNCHCLPDGIKMKSSRMSVERLKEAGNSRECCRRHGREVSFAAERDPPAPRTPPDGGQSRGPQCAMLHVFSLTLRSRVRFFKRSTFGLKLSATISPRIYAASGAESTGQCPNCFKNALCPRVFSEVNVVRCMKRAEMAWSKRPRHSER